MTTNSPFRFPAYAQKHLMRATLLISFQCFFTIGPRFCYGIGDPASQNGMESVPPLLLVDQLMRRSLIRPRFWKAFR